MKKLIIVLAAVLLGSIATSALAHQDQSFLYNASSGIFEETYDLFKYSPAYLPTFQKNAFWGQLSNLTNGTERIVNNSATDYYLVGGTSDILGMGRLGLMFDWYSETSEVNNRTWNNSTTFSGFGEYDYVRYRDRDSDNIIDYREETYGHSEMSTNYSNADIYAAFGLGQVEGMEVGLGIRGDWEAWAPTYDTGTPAQGLNNYGGSFDWGGWELQEDLITGQPILRRDMSAEGSLAYGTNRWQAILAARSSGIMGMMPELDAVLNLRVIMDTQSNEYDWNYSYSEDLAPADPSQYNSFTRAYEESGIEGGVSSYLPGSGLGIGVDARVDYDLNPGIKFTGWLGLETVGIPVKTDTAKQDTVLNGTWLNTGWNGSENITITNTSNTTTASTWDGSVGKNIYSAKGRLIFPANGFDFGLGLRLSSEQYKTDTTRTDFTTETYRHVEPETVPDPSNDYTAVTTYGVTTHAVVDDIQNTIELPLAFNFKFLDNFHVQIGASHNIYFGSYTTSSYNTDRTLVHTVTTYDDGDVDNTVAASTANYEEQSNSQYYSYHDTRFSYGVTWWPFEQVRVDFTYLNYLTYLYLYRFSVNLYY